MKEEQNSLTGKKETSRPEETKIRRYVRLTISTIGLALFFAVIAMAAWRKFGS